ncbi:LysR family transcriptional regulator [Martelella radicis]|uniref:DNA-binding transcriptional LysR family regulator n=1 Tax=Martelella radicis TaxID=1397476 RepID=A0A7W6KHX2_9HYPH|nr:LysR family transcriptional regulator [Martelella radicis]MBB4121423.1 DNA-binding transcriptional LysR family regulator [Martelella radicis]
MKISLRQLEYVVAASQLGSIAGAAEDMGISTSSILAAIEKFEQEFAVQLFVRQRSKGLVTTAMGARAIARTIRLLDETRSFAEDLQGRDTALTGDLRVGAFTSISPNIAPGVIRDLSIRHPDMIVHLTEGDILSIQRSLRDGAVDILLTYDAGLSDELDQEMLAQAPPHVVLSQSHPLADKPRISLKDLAGHPLLLLNLPHSRRYVMSLFDREGVTPGRIQRLESFEMVRSAAAAGLGAAILNVRPPDDNTYSGMRVACRPLDCASKSPAIVLVTRRGGRISRRAEAFAAACRRFFETPTASALFLK